MVHPNFASSVTRHTALVHTALTNQIFVTSHIRQHHLQKRKRRILPMLTGPTSLPPSTHRQRGRRLLTERQNELAGRGSQTCRSEQSSSDDQTVLEVVKRHPSREVGNVQQCQTARQPRPPARRGSQVGVLEQTNEARRQHVLLGECFALNDHTVLDEACNPSRGVGNVQQCQTARQPRPPDTHPCPPTKSPKHRSCGQHGVSAPLQSASLEHGGIPAVSKATHGEVEARCSVLQGGYNSRKRMSLKLSALPCNVAQQMPSIRGALPAVPPRITQPVVDQWEARAERHGRKPRQQGHSDIFKLDVQVAFSHKGKQLYS